MTGLEVRDLYKSYGPSPVLRGIDLDVAEGSFTAILGPSGSGKTTLLRVIAGFERAERGVIRLGGVVVEDDERHLAPEHRHIGYVPQEGSLFPHLSVEANVGFGLARRDRRGKRVALLLEMVGLGGLESRYPHQLSGGQQQRVALARALAIEPALVLLDEPFSSLDAGLRATVRQDVRRVLKDAGTTAVLVTHDQDEALSLSDHVAVIIAGRIGQVGTPRELYAHPVSPELARGLGETNFLRGVASNGAAVTALGLLRLENWAARDGAASAGAARDGAASDGTELVVLVRPEQILLRGRDGAVDGAALGAEVVASEFYGHDAIVRVRTDRDPTSSITVRTTDAVTLPEPGSRVGIEVHGAVVGWAARSGDPSPESPTEAVTRST